MIEEENKDNKKKTINLNLQHILLQQWASHRCWDKWERIQLTSSEHAEVDLELDQTDAEASLKTSENYWLLFR